MIYLCSNFVRHHGILEADSHQCLKHLDVLSQLIVSSRRFNGFTSLLRYEGVWLFLHVL
jgi:hypothetical protein